MELFVDGLSRNVTTECANCLTFFSKLRLGDTIPTLIYIEAWCTVQVCQSNIYSVLGHNLSHPHSVIQAGVN